MSSPMTTSVEYQAYISPPPAASEDEHKRKMDSLSSMLNLIWALHAVLLVLCRWHLAPCLLLCPVFFSEFPNSMRHPCTTMPWTIWPSLAVLWGVCWMFFAFPAGQADNLGLYSWNLSTMSNNSGTDQAQMLGLGAIWEAFDFDGSLAESIPLTPSAGFVPAVGIQPSDFGSMYPGEDPSRASVGSFMPPHSLAMSPPSSFTGSSARAGYASSGHSQANPASSPEVADLPSRRTPRRRKPRNGYHRCRECDRVFARSDTLTRHRRLLHGPGEDIFFCWDPDCDRSTNGFKRRDNLVQHLNCVHKQKFPPQAGEVDAASEILVGEYSLSAQPDGQELACLGELKKQHHETGVSQDMGNEPLDEVAILRRRLATAEQECRQLRSENEELREQKRVAEGLLDSALDIVRLPHI